MAYLPLCPAPGECPAPSCLLSTLHALPVCDCAIPALSALMNARAAACALAGAQTVA
ncbi:hypothetical protein MAHJHV54_34710 [Mycobacterium avium subsp. hominissuis]